MIEFSLQHRNVDSEKCTVGIQYVSFQQATKLLKENGLIKKLSVKSTLLPSERTWSLHCHARNPLLLHFSKQINMLAPSLRKYWPLESLKVVRSCNINHSTILTTAFSEWWFTGKQTFFFSHTSLLTSWWRLKPDRLF